MSQLIKYLFIYPILTLIDLIDSVIGFVYLDSHSNRKLKNLPPPEAVHSVQIDVAPEHISYRSVNGQTLFRIDEDDLSVYEAVVRSAKTLSDVKMLGYREVLSVDEEKQPNGKVLKKMRMKNEYTWITYKELVRRVDDLANGLLNIGLKSNDNIVIFAETRPEWLMCAVACFKIKVPVVTLYATLGLDALAYGINQTNATYLIASGESVLKLHKVIDKCEKLKNVVVITDKFTEKNLIPLKEKSLSVYSMNDVEDIGRTKPRIETYERPKKNDLAIIMYTSGSTGTPKGAMMSHGNLLTSLISLIPRFGERSSKDELYISYLPSAHVLELCSQIGWLIKGIGIGYSSPFTLTDNSTAIKEGDLGDISVLKPTFMIAVPIVLERIKKAVEEKMAKQSDVLKCLFEVASAKRLHKAKQGKSSFLIDRLLFKKIKAALGGNLETLLVGGSMLNRDVHEFGQACFCRVIQAYGLTETCAAATAQYPNETISDQVGSVVECGELRLVDWPEGGYRVSDKPNPRGEIWIGGDQVCLGYYNMPDKTQEDFRVVDGIRFFATGDIGEMSPEGNLSIIDRKKDLVKLQGGEYISLNKVETVIKLMPLVDNCCVVAHPSKSYCICIITPNLKKAQELFDSSKTSNGDINHSSNNASQDIITEFINLFDSNSKLSNNFNKELVEFCLNHGLERFEIPTKSKFVKEIWLPDSGLVTDSLKLKRREIEKFYENEIKTIYV